MTQKYIKTPIPAEISDKGGATIQFVERQTVPLETSVREAIDGLFVLGQEELVRANFFGLMRSASDGIRRDGHARQIGDHITIYPVVTGEIDMDHGWNPAVNGVRIIARLLNELELDITNWSFEDVTPGKQSFKLNTVSTLGVEGIAEIGKVIALNGSGLPKTDAIRVEWAVEGTDKSGTIPAAKVTSNDVRANIAEDALAELASEEYDGKTIVFTVRGNFSSSKISAMLKYVAPVPPHLTGIVGSAELKSGGTLKVAGGGLPASVEAWMASENGLICQIKTGEGETEWDMCWLLEDGALVAADANSFEVDCDFLIEKLFTDQEREFVPGEVVTLRLNGNVGDTTLANLDFQATCR